MECSNNLGDREDQWNSNGNEEKQRDGCQD